MGGIVGARGARHLHQDFDEALCWTSWCCAVRSSEQALRNTSWHETRRSNQPYSLQRDGWESCARAKTKMGEKETWGAHRLEKGWISDQLTFCSTILMAGRSFEPAKLMLEELDAETKLVGLEMHMGNLLKNGVGSC